MVNYVRCAHAVMSVYKQYIDYMRFAYWAR
jgi:hypothetical protein